jgi:hypothetical protein
MKQQHYFQFPLCALSFVADAPARLNYIVSFGCVEVGKKQWQKLQAWQQRALRSTSPDPRRYECPIDRSNDAHLEVMAGAERLHLIIKDIEGTLAGHATLTEFIKEFEARYGTDGRVRIRTDWVLETRDGKGMSYQELAVLAAIYSKIGSRKGPVRISRDEIWKRAHGFKSDRVFSAEMNGQSPSKTRRQVRSIIERLYARKFFARVTFAQRHTYYSHRMSPKALEEGVFRLKTGHHVAKLQSRTANATLTRKVREERQRLAAAMDVHVHAAAFESRFRTEIRGKSFTVQGFGCETSDNPSASTGMRMEGFKASFGRLKVNCGEHYEIISGY